MEFKDFRGESLKPGDKVLTVSKGKFVERVIIGMHYNVSWRGDVYTKIRLAQAEKRTTYDKREYTAYTWKTTVSTGDRLLKLPA